MANRERSIKVDAIVIRHKDWGEADRLLTLYTYQKGKLRAIAKGVRKLNSRKSGHLEPFSHVKLQLARGKDFWIVTQAETVAANTAIQMELSALGYASYACELVDRFSLEEEQNSALFQLLAETVQRLGRGQEYQIAIRFFEIHLLDLLGYRPHLQNCASCYTEIKPEAQFFSLEQGGVICPACAQKGSGTGLPISMTALKYLRHFQRSTYTEARRAIVSEATMLEMEKLLQSYLTYLLEQRIRSTDFIQIIRQQERKAGF
jgi:DNA repair protein RecO (recombination protein O)